MTERQRKTISAVWQGNLNWGPVPMDGPLDDLIRSLLAVRRSIPSEWRSTAICRIDAENDYGSPYPTVEITYSRPETDEEEAARCAEHNKRLNAAMNQEIATYLRLKEKYGNKLLSP